METNNKLKFIRLKKLEPDCRCCGNGTKHICSACERLLNRGYAFFLEMKDSATMEKKKFTGYAIAFKASQVTDHDTDAVMQPGIYFIHQTELKEFLGDAYNNYRTGGADKGKLLADVRRFTVVPASRPDTKVDSESAESTRHSAELVHG